MCFTIQYVVPVSANDWEDFLRMCFSLRPSSRDPVVVNQHNTDVFPVHLLKCIACLYKYPRLYDFKKVIFGGRTRNQSSLLNRSHPDESQMNTMKLEPSAGSQGASSLQQLDQR